MANDLDIAGATGMGAAAGAATGAQIGSIVPGAGTAVGAGVGAVVGGVGSFNKAKQASQAEQAIMAQDPQELARLAEIDRIRKSIGAGTDPLTQQAISRSQQAGATTQQRIARVTGGDVGATIAGMTRAQAGTQAATNQAITASQQRLPFFENLGQQLRTRVSQRALEVGLLKRDQALAENAAKQKAASANLAGALGGLGNQQGIPQSGGGGGVPVSGSPMAQTPMQGGLDQNGLKATSSFTEPNAVGLNAGTPPSLQADFGAGNNLLPAGFGAGAQPQMQIANQGLNTPIQQVPIATAEMPSTPGFFPTEATRATPLIDPLMQTIGSTTSSGL